MIIRNHPIAPRRGNEPIAQGIALGKGNRQFRPERAKALTGNNAYALSGRTSLHFHTQGDALGYELLAFQAVPSVASEQRSSAGRLSVTCG